MQNLASLATELPVLWAVSAHLLPMVDAHLLDVGVSYGFFATAGALVLMLPTPARWWVLSLLNACVLAIYVTSGPASTDAVVTVAGHTLSLYIGMVGWLPWLRNRHLVGSVHLPAGPRRHGEAPVDGRGGRARVRPCSRSLWRSVWRRRLLRRGLRLPLIPGCVR